MRGLGRYEPSKWWWEPIELLKKLFFCGILLILGPEEGGSLHGVEGSAHLGQAALADEGGPLPEGAVDAFDKVRRALTVLTDEKLRAIHDAELLGGKKKKGQTERGAGGKLPPRSVACHAVAEIDFLHNAVDAITGSRSSVSTRSTR